MRDHSGHIELDRDGAVAGMLAACDFHPGTETIPVDEACGRVLARDAVAQVTLPNCLTSRMDSIAVHWDDFSAGIPDTSSWERGVQWDFANTGVGMPEGYDTAIVVEHAVFGDDGRLLSIDALPSARFAGTSPAGSRMHEGDVLVEAGTRLTPLLAAHIVSGGNTEVHVVARPKVAFIPTGNELVPAGAAIPRGGNIDSNSVLLKGKIAAMGGEPLVFDIVPDDPVAIEAALRDAAVRADIIVINAGSSKGSDDWTLELLERIGTVLNHQTNHGPGHHSSYSLLDGVPVVGISGPPGGAAFTTDFYLKPLMDVFLGLDPAPVKLRARLAAPLEAPSHGVPSSPARPLPGETRPKEAGYGNVFYTIRQMILSSGADGYLEATPTGSVHPGPVEAESASAYLLVPKGKGHGLPQVGDIVEVELRR